MNDLNQLSDLNHRTAIPVLIDIMNMTPAVGLVETEEQHNAFATGLTISTNMILAG